MFINVYKCLYKFDLGDTNVWMLDSINVFQTFPNIILTKYEMFGNV